MQKTCGVLITNGTHILMCHPTGAGERWDIPKGKQDQGEDDVATAIRELHEETGLHVDARKLSYLGIWPYKPGKKMSLFSYKVDIMPNIKDLTCISHFNIYGHDYPEMDGYENMLYYDALSRVNIDLRKIMEPLLKKNS